MNITNPYKTLDMSGIDYLIDWPEHVVYVDNLQKLAEYCGMNWSVLADAVEWRGWTWRNLR